MRPRSRFLIAAAAGCLPLLGLAPAATASAAVHHDGVLHAAVRPAAARAMAIARREIRQLHVGQHATDRRTGTAAVRPDLSQVSSDNWSGYADTGSGFSRVSATWTEPSVTCTSQTRLAALWVGLDGYSSNSVEQDGTLIECYEGAAYHYSWWEMYPSNDIQVVGSSVAAGDQISAVVTRSGTSYTLTVTDATRPANSFSTTQACSSCANSSAEWIAEAPTGSSGVEPLADFHTWTASNDDVTEGSASGVISSFTDDEITMVDSSNRVKAQPSGLSGSGNSFTSTWERAS